MREDEVENLDAGGPISLGGNVEPMGVGLPPEIPSHAEKKEELAGVLHKDTPLPNLRTYHGDIAEFIKNKDQSLSDIALKQNEKKRAEKAEAAAQKSEVNKADEPNRGKFSELP